MQDAILGQPFDRGDPLPGHAGGLDLARLNRPAANQHRAGAAGPLAAAELGPGQVQVVAQELEEALPFGGICRVIGPVDNECEAHVSTLTGLTRVLLR